MQPITFTDSCLPELELQYWPEFGLLELWVKKGPKQAFKRASPDLRYLDTPTAQKVAQELLTGVLEGAASKLGICIH